MPALSRPLSRSSTAPQARAPWGWAASGALLGGVLALLLAAPARWLADGLDAATGHRLQLQQAEGTVWNGSARLVLASGEAGAATSALPGTLHWTLRPRWAGLDLNVRASCCLDAAWPWRLRLHDGALLLQADDLAASASHWPAEVLIGLGTPWNTLQLRGSLSVSTQDFAMAVRRDGWSVNGQAAVEAWGMGTALTTLHPVGSYRLALQGGAQARTTLNTLAGPLQLSGQGQLEQGRWRFTGEARADEAAQSALGNLLNIIGRRVGARSVITVG